MQSIFQMRRLGRAVSNAEGLDLETRSPQGVALEATPKDTIQPRTLSFDGPNDPENPQNWSKWKRAGILGIIALVAFIVGFGSSIDSAILPQASERFGVSPVAESLATALYLIGFGCGAPFAGPLSEEWGRLPVYLITFTLYCCWILAAALAPNFGAQLAFRFLAGTCGSTPFTVAGGTLGDIYDHHERGKIFPFFAFIAFLGPMLAPVVGGYVGMSGIGWRWTEWITFIVSCGVLALMILFLPETDAKEILRWKANALRAKGLEVEESRRLPLRRRLTTALSRPVVILFTQPVIAIFTAYLTLVYGVAFCFFSSAQYIFGETHDFNQGSTYLMFVSIIVGLLICAFCKPLFEKLIKREHSKARAQGKADAGPEVMLWWAMIGGPLLPISVFWMAWSARPSVSWWSPMISSAFFGFSLLSLFISTYGFIMHKYTSVAASALVSNTFTRYLVGGGIVVVSIPMFENLGVPIALTIFGAISCVFTPVPFLLYLNSKRKERKDVFPVVNRASSANMSSSLPQAPAEDDLRLLTSWLTSVDLSPR